MYPYKEFHIIFAQPLVCFHLVKCPHCGQSNGGYGVWFEFHQVFCDPETYDHIWTLDSCDGGEYYESLVGIVTVNNTYSEDSRWQIPMLVQHLLPTGINRK